MSSNVSETSTPSVDPRPRERSTPRVPLRDWLSFSRISGLYVWAAMIVIFALTIPDSFLTRTTWQDIAGSNAIVAIAGIGLLLPLTAGAYDLSVGQAIGTSAIISAWLLHHGLGVPATIAVTLAGGVLVGLVNGALVVLLKINSFIATLGTSAILLALDEAVSNGEQIVGVPSSFERLGTAQPLGLPIVVFYLAVLAVIGWYVLEHTPLGRYLHAVGGGTEAARLAGVNARLYLFVALVGCSLIASFAGLIVTAQLGAGAPDVGPPYLLPVFAAAFLGGTQIMPGRLNVVGLLIAVYLLATGVKGLQLAGGSYWVTDLFNGCVLVLAVGLAGLTQRPRFLRRRRPAPEGAAVQRT